MHLHVPRYKCYTTLVYAACVPHKNVTAPRRSAFTTGVIPHFGSFAGGKSWSPDAPNKIAFVLREGGTSREVEKSSRVHHRLARQRTRPNYLAEASLNIWTGLLPAVLVKILFRFRRARVPLLRSSFDKTCRASF